MELLYELLREACTCFLLSFLVVRLISLIVSSTDDPAISGLIKDKGVKRSATIDHHLLVGHEKKQLDELKSVYDDAETQNKRVKFVDHNDIDIVSSKVNAIDEDLFYVKKVDVQEISKLVEFGGDLVDHEKPIVGFEDKVVGELESVVGHIKEAILTKDDENCHDIGVNLGRKEIVDGESCSNVYKGEVSGREFDVDEGVLSDEEEWEGIERSELEKSFARAMNFVGCKAKQEFLVSKLGNDVMMQFYGLQKIAMEGPCHEARPLAIKRSARANWNAWQKLGSMTREDAMEQYISILSDAVPEWMEEASTILVKEWKSGSSRTTLDSPPETN